ncbi:four-carbon acid sugar kinase family protein [Rhizobium rhizogenes]|uniref:four-carbon acid sugar kinase family protein n=1 Tax=Rhizobium rhizogenes TaxID=359 RepID=UPI003ED141EC
MKLKVAIIADDLTGALDTGTPFVEAGLSVTVAIDIDAIADALASRSEVVVINTASRALSEEKAVARIGLAANALVAASPEIILKKIDSRLKGHVAAESAALAAAFGHREIVLAPAIPDQERFTRNGKVIGRGVDYPLTIAELFIARPETVLVIDAESDGDLDRLVVRRDWKTSLAVGARGIGSALARHVGREGSASQNFVPTARTLFAFGSRDPITAAQMATLEASGSLGATIDAPMGLVKCGKGQALPLLLRCTGDITEEATAVANRFANGVTSVMEDTHPDMLMMGGGDTAAAVFRTLGIRLLTPKGEIEPGIPWFDVTMANGTRLRCAVKSGGFGNSDSLLRLIPQNQAA